MKITFLGTSHGIAEKNRFCSSAAITVGGKHYVIDAGAPLMSLLQTYDLAFENIGGIFITHTHEDHMLGLVELTCQLNVFPHFEHVHFPVYVPDEEKYRRMMDFLEIREGFGGRLLYQVYGDGVIFDDGMLKVVAIPVNHIPNAHCFMLEAEGKRVFFTGDLLKDLSDYPLEIHKHESDLVVMEAAHCKLMLDENVKILKQSKTDCMIITHRYFPQNPPDEFEIFRTKMGDVFNILEAYDGMTLEL